MLHGRALLTDLYDAAVAGAAPGPLTAAELDRLDLAPGRRICLIAVGKAATGMAAAATATLERAGHVVARGIVVAPEPAPPPGPRIRAMVGDHPVPGPRSFAAASAIGDIAAAGAGDDLVVVLLSGGASSLMAAPAEGLGEATLVALWEALLRSGLDIRDMNTVRRRFAQWGGGRLALALDPAPILVLVVSDVPGNDPADVGSGPCAPDEVTEAQILALLGRCETGDSIQTLLRHHLDKCPPISGPSGHGAPAAFAHVSTRVIGSNPLALESVVARCTAIGLPCIVGDVPLRGEAAVAGARLAADLVGRARGGDTGAVVWGGETTVTFSPGAGSPAPGGRCQELALSAARVLGEQRVAGRAITLLAAGTDGRDGPTDAAGAFADDTTWRAIVAAGGDPALALARHASYEVLDAAGALLRRGLTGTNVMDVVIGLIERAPLRRR